MKKSLKKNLKKSDQAKYLKDMTNLNEEYESVTSDIDLEEGVEDE